MLQGKSLEHKRGDLQGLALVLIHLKNPHTILEDGRMHVNNPRDVSREAREFVEMTKSATYRELFQVSSFSGRRTVTNRQQVRFSPESPSGTSSVVFKAS